MSNPIRGWVRLTIRAIPKKPWYEDMAMMKSMAMALVTMIFIVLSVQNGYCILNTLLPAFKHLWGISFLVVAAILYCLLWERIIRVVKYNVRMREKNESTRR